MWWWLLEGGGGLYQSLAFSLTTVFGRSLKSYVCYIIQIKIWTGFSNFCPYVFVCPYLNKNVNCNIRLCHRQVKISFSWKLKMCSEKIKPFYALKMGNILIFNLKPSKQHFLPLHYTQAKFQNIQRQNLESQYFELLRRQTFTKVV